MPTPISPPRGTPAPLADVLADVYAHLLLKRQERLALQPAPAPEAPRPEREEAAHAPR